MTGTVIPMTPSNRGIPQTVEGTVIQKIVEQCIADSQIWFPHIADNVPYTALALAGEVGEVCNIVKKIERGDFNEDPSAYDQAAADLREEVTDVFIYLMNLAGMLQLDLVKSYNEKRAKNVGRFDI